MNANLNVTIALVYCDYIADCIRNELRNRRDNGVSGIIGHVAPVQWDLHPEGWMVSTRKTIRVTDTNGRAYRVTVEEETP